MNQDMTATDEVISSFICPADPDIESFLKTRAIKFENASKSRTYLLFDKEAVHTGKLRLLAYFTIALHILIVPEGFSGNRVKKLDGFSSTLRGKRISEFPCYIIGQLGKNAAYPTDSITGDIIMEYALGVIGQTSELVGGRIVLIECRHIDYLVNFYRRNGFNDYDNEPDLDGNSMIQMIRLIY
ncbi:hypothetical protein Desgi_3940 [Desulfoscipio gibsoniae DSM 7213]|uniref:N-acetyltransferase domain-containing protein n=2 Tax=Desulfoscipio gibsoniae TaxID=102134 RepID=R4KUC4_9FIRM|nr:hypothetical protein Desgi_3940 [Desulfoscipio gibsoniae DSM 7213]